MNEINVLAYISFVPWQLLGIKLLERLSIKIDDPNWTTIAEVVYNSLFNNEPSTKINNELDSNFTTDETINQLNAIFNNDKETTKTKSETETIDL